MKKLRLLAIGLIILSACSKPNTGNNNPPGCTKPSTPVAGSNGTVGFGGSIKLTATTVANAKYKWSGPGSFSSTDQNPQIDNAVPGMAGKYYVKAIVGTCVSDSTATDVSVSSISVPCTQADNTGIVTPVSGVPANLTFMPYCLPKGSEYQVTASDVPDGNYQIIANFKTMPTQSGIYYTSDLAVSATFACYITAQNTKTSRNYHSTPGNYVYVTVTGGSINVRFCEVYLDDPAYTNDHMTVTANITCQ
jgi:hypothetical protein